MNLEPMRFKDYVWPHNPRVYEINYKKDIVSHRMPFGLYTLQNMGRQHRVMRGEGEFAGQGAYEEFKKLATVFYDSKPGVLTHPLWDTTTAYFAALQVEQEPTENYVRYSFEFWECYSGYDAEIKELGQSGGESGGTEVEHCVEEGENIWSIAAKYDVAAEEIVEANPTVKNPAALGSGLVLRIKWGDRQ